MAKKRRTSLKQKLKNLASKRKSDSKLTNRIIDGITIAFGVQNILPTTLASGGSIMTRLKSAANELTGRTTGLNIFPDAPQFARHFSVENALTNPQTTAGIIALIWNEASKRIKVLPLKAESKRFAKKNIAVGIGTGLFGDGAFSLSTTLGIGTGQSNPAINVGQAN